MGKCRFQYQSSDGKFTERAITDWIASMWPDSIDAQCELRQEARSFDVRQMANLVDLETGEVISDPWVYFGIAKTTGEDGMGRQSLDTLTWEALPAIKALKFFTITTRDFSKRERLKLTQFVEEVCRISIYSKDEIGEWLQKLWCGNIYDYRDGKTEEYAGLLQVIPSNLMPICQDYALWIARGSGRKEPDPFWLRRIESEFSEIPHILQPQLRLED